MNGSLLALGLVAILPAPKAAAPGTPWDAPLLVVERNNVVWPEKCEGGTLPDGVGTRVEALIGSTSAELVFTGNGRVADAALGESFCLPGECGAAQVGLPLVKGGDTDAAGVVIPKSLLGKAEALALELVGVEGNDTYGDGRLVAGKQTALPGCGDAPKSADERGAVEKLYDCRTYRVAGSGPTLGLQVQGGGILQENNYPLYATVRFRLLEKSKKGQEWKAGPWHAQPRGEGTRLPTPVAILAGGKAAKRVIWLRQEGICCPSESSAWVTEVGTKLRVGAQHAAGFGQSCD